MTRQVCVRNDTLLNILGAEFLKEMITHSHMWRRRSMWIHLKTLVVDARCHSRNHSPGCKIYVQLTVQAQRTSYDEAVIWRHLSFPLTLTQCNVLPVIHGSSATYSLCLPKVLQDFYCSKILLTASRRIFCILLIAFKEFNWQLACLAFITLSPLSLE